MNDDLISRSALLNHAYSIATSYGGGYVVDVDDIDNAPTVDSVDLKDILDYIDKTFDRTPYEGSWITDSGERVSCDVGYAWEWWSDLMKPELIRVFGKEE
jgi:hypothetical protein